MPNIVDKEESPYTAKDMPNIVLTDDGYGELVNIPSVFVAKEDGKELIDALRQGFPVIVELEWRLPRDHVVRFDWWMSSASVQSYKLLKEFAPKRRALNDVMNFQPHYAVFSVEGNNGAMMSNLCLDSATAEFCAEDPDGPGPITGANVLHENVRQRCIHEIHKIPLESPYSLRAGHGTAGVHFAEKFWAYVEKFIDRCPLDGTSPEHRFGLQCSVKLMQEVGIDQTVVDQCVLENTTRYLKEERNNQAWSPRALRINGWRYNGMLDADLIARAICSGFTQQPKACKELVKERNPMQPYYVTKVEGFSMTQMLTMLVGVGAISAVGMQMYKRSMTHKMRSTLREEVMLEVQSQLGEYKKMTEGGGSAHHNKGLEIMMERN